ncbi:MAG: dipeptidase [Clostridia bacterium]
MNRRALLKASLALLASTCGVARAYARVPIADMHSHYGLISRQLGRAPLAQEMRNAGVALVAWKLVSDLRHTRTTPTGIEPKSTPAPGELAAYFVREFGRMKAAIAKQKLRTVLTRADVDACIAGEAGVVLASEGADFLEGKLEGLAAAYGKGLRHLQLVHYIPTPVGDRQTAAPSHDGLSGLGRELIAACNARGILVDLAHCSPASLDQALEIAKEPILWSHGWVDDQEGRWGDPYGYQRRALSFDQAKKIADRGGVVGLWGLALTRPISTWPVAPGDQAAYARQLARLVDRIGADHVGIGTDVEGVGDHWTVDNYADVRKVVDALEGMKLPASVVERVAYANYARVLKSALRA